MNKNIRLSFQLIAVLMAFPCHTTLASSIVPATVVDTHKDVSQRSLPPLLPAKLAAGSTSAPSDSLPIAPTNSLPKSVSRAAPSLRLAASNSRSSSPTLLLGQKSGCRPEVPLDVEISEDEKEVALTFKRMPGAGCLTAASSEASWVEAVIQSASDTVMLKVKKNDQSTARAAHVYVAISGDSFVFNIQQAAAQSTQQPVTPAIPPRQSSDSVQPK